jgi:hypothetical protein
VPPDDELSGRGLEALAGMTCVGILAARKLADSAAYWWVRRLAERQGALSSCRRDVILSVSRPGYWRGSRPSSMWTQRIESAWRSWPSQAQKSCPAGYRNLAMMRRRSDRI